MFIVLEGPDGSGKSTQAALLAERYRARGLSVVLTAEPTYEGIGARIRRILKGDEEPVSPADMAALYADDRLSHAATVLFPAFIGGNIVVCDRYVLSSIAYQTATGVHLDLVRGLNRYAPRPDLTVVIDVLDDVAAERMRARGAVDRFERDADLQSNVRDVYARAEEFLIGEKVVHVDGNGNQDEVAARVWSAAKGA